MKKLILAVLICCFSGSYASAQKKDYVETVKEYMEVMGSYEAYKAIVPQLIDIMKMQYQLPNEVWKMIEAELTDDAFVVLAEMIAPLYERYVTRADLQAAIDFYKTPAGRKIAEATPKIASEAMQVGQNWGLELGTKIEEKIKGYNLQ